MIGRTGLALTACVALATLNPAVVAAQPAAEPSAMLRGAHFSPDTPSVDVYLTSFGGGDTTLALSDVGYGDVSDYSRLEPGQYTVGMRPSGADPSTPVVFSWTLDAKPGEAFTALAIGMNESLEGRVLSDNLSAPPTGSSRVRIVQAASNAPRADIAADAGPVFGQAVPFTATTDYSEVPSGSWPVTAAASEDASISTTLDTTLDAGQANTIVLLDAAEGGLSLKVIDDAVGVDLPPQGPVEAGEGAAVASDSQPTGWVRQAAFGGSAVALAATLVLLGLTLRRRPI